MENDLSSLPDDLLDVRQDLSQYSYDPSETLEALDNQQLSQSSEKLDGFLPYADAGFMSDDQADLFYSCDFNSTYTTSAERSDGVVATENCCKASTSEYESVQVTSEVGNFKHAPTGSLTAAPLILEFFGNEIAFDVKAELSVDFPTPSTSATYSPDSSSTANFSYEDADVELSITDDLLLKLSTRDLNRQIRRLPIAEQQKLKNRRRTLKNRGYAQTCRTRRVGMRSELQADNKRLSAQIERLTAEKRSLAAECERLRKESAELSTEQLHDEIEKLRTKVDFLTNERDTLCSEGARFRGERDSYKDQLNYLLEFLAGNGTVIDE